MITVVYFSSRRAERADVVRVYKSNMKIHEFSVWKFNKQAIEDFLGEPSGKRVFVGKTVNRLGFKYKFRVEHPCWKLDDSALDIINFLRNTKAAKIYLFLRGIYEPKKGEKYAAFLRKKLNGIKRPMEKDEAIEVAGVLYSLTF
ncbi:MAG: hypothetical protein QXL06_01845 [Nitrososphaerota archaeon]